MKIEFKKIPQDKKEFSTSLNSVKIEGTFCRISSSLVKIEANLIGNIETDCSRCGTLKTLDINEELKLLLCDGVFKGDEDEFLVIEIENSLIDFDEIIQSEVNSIKSDYLLCGNCETNDSLFEQEF
ncbi:hypothetical protein CRU87_01000 [Aliarcobacter trophiarum LMG 25534]|uniref:Uncharacterized protein n=1 Tax=Aliarcobacter trophiarum LMG 25534 TaxID=1032241 RepID=A0AAD0VLG7_9BACT|nr:hypothetical protein [Aliarcobacter trophiarum]AXK48228.1 hypothetical protein ATR_0343 [Aliarcobacter trophiarum LMG 25534]RXI28494.1 hypothetical protein CRU89_00650 [Aliarcobacter trophiarum]RXJ93097.1 hypothetical protein CRU87_01000 [Aliarcobacter trophiarum LMG 25534]